MARRYHPVRWLDVAVAAVVGFLVADSPLMPRSTGPKLAIGTITAALFLWFRSTHPDQGVAATTRGLGSGLRDFARALPVPVWLCVGAWLALFGPTLAWMYEKWTGSFWSNNHSLIVAVLIVLLARARLRRFSGPPQDASLLGLPFLVAGLVLLVGDYGMRSQQIASIGLVATLPGMSLLLLGRARTRALWLPLAMSVFLVPLPSLVSNHMYLRTITADWTVAVLQALGVRASLFHSLIEIPDTVFVVSEACSGFSTFVAAIALSLFLVAATRSTARRIAIVAAIVPLTLVANTVRVVLLVFLTRIAGTQILDTMAHEGSGVATFIVVIGTLFWIADRPHLSEAFR
ncbi:MAG: exosortase/archaeosortase family protein [Myxococcota bacterium]|nr:exosortase/archaeosortase family protein [Myxococcales bacterium]